MTRRIAWLNEKGGTGKSTSALNVAAILASRHAKRVLLVDADHQANVTTSLSGGREGSQTLAHVLVEGLPVAKAIRKTAYDGLELLPADAALSDVNVAMADPHNPLGMGREVRLRRALEPVGEDYDFIIVDTSPQRTLLNINVLNFVDEVFVPIDPGYWSVMGVQNLEDLLSQVRDHLGNDPLRIAGVLLTKMQRTNVAREVEEQVRSYFGDRVLRTTVPLNVKVEEAHSRGRSVADYAPESQGATAYLAVTEEILARDQENRPGVDAVPQDDARGTAA